jgi:hypothetical protein
MRSSPWRSIASPSQRVRSALSARSTFEGRRRRKSAERRRGLVLLLLFALTLPVLLGLAPRWWGWKRWKLNGEEADGDAEEAGDAVVEVGRRLLGEGDGNEVVRERLGYIFAVFSLGVFLKMISECR